MKIICLLLVFANFCYSQYLTPDEFEQNAKGTLFIETPEQAYPIINKNYSKTIMGAALYTGSLAVEWGIIYPWATRINQKAFSSGSSDSIDLTESFQLLALSVPVSILKVVGPSLACAGASRIYGAYHDGIDKSTPDIQVWKPYAIGWGLGAVGGIMGYIGGFSKSKELVNIGTGFSIARDICWGVSTVLSVVYSGKMHQQTKQQKLTIEPNQKNNGVIMTLTF